MTQESPNKISVVTPHAPAAIGPYSQAIQTEKWIFTSGQIGIKLNTAGLISDEAGQQIRQGLENLRQVVLASGYTLDHVVKTTVFLTDMNDFSTMNEIYGEFFSAPFPARSTVAVAQLPLNAKFEIEAILNKG
jgi:2-iminobutanoate/2-iminopropanoate deaminase